MSHIYEVFHLNIPVFTNTKIKTKLEGSLLFKLHWIPQGWQWERTPGLSWTSRSPTLHPCICTFCCGELHRSWLQSPLRPQRALFSVSPPTSEGVSSSSLHIGHRTKFQVGLGVWREVSPCDSGVRCPLALIDKR